MTVPVPPLVGVNAVMVGAGMKVKEAVLVAVPPGVVTVIVPVAPLPSVAVSEVPLPMVKEAAAVTPNCTAVAPVKLVPVTVTTTPVAPLIGVNEVMVGAGIKVKAPVLVAVPPGVVTVIIPVAPLPTVAVIEVALTPVKEAVAVPPKATAVVPVKFVPVIVTTAPAAPVDGVNEVMVGAGMKVKVPVLATVPPGVVTLIVPVAPLPIVAVIEVSLTRVKVAAGVPLKTTAVAPVK